MSALRSHFGASWHFPDITAAISRTDLGDPKDSTQRSRGFLFACLASVFALRLGLAEANFADNGVVSLNLPLNRQVVNTRASRSTHPKFLRLVNELLRSLFSNPPAVVNPLLQKTRPEALELLKAAGAHHLAKETVSCVHTRLMKPGKDHCGTCSQCIDRRFAMIAAGLDTTEDVGRYDQEIFAGELPKEAARTMATGYHGFVTELELLPDDALIERYPELYTANQPQDALQPLGLAQLINLLRRHSATSLAVMETVINRQRSELARGTLPDTCLLRLINPTVRSAEPVEQASSNGALWHSPDYRRILWEDEWQTLSPNQARVIELLDQQSSAGLSQAYVLVTLELKATNLHQVFRGSGSWAWNTLVVSRARGVFALNAPENH